MTGNSESTTMSFELDRDMLFGVSPKIVVAVVGKFGPGIYNYVYCLCFYGFLGKLLRYQFLEI